MNTARCALPHLRGFTSLPVEGILSLMNLLTTCLILFLAGCNSQDSLLTVADIRSGDYQFYTVAVDDGCLDGALEALFMPEGSGTPHAFQYLVFVPSADELPISYSVDFREPFVGMEVTVDSPDGVSLQVQGSVMEAVELGGSTGDCVTDMKADATLTPAESQRLVGTATISVMDPRGDDQLCPVFQQDPCQVVLELEAVLP